MLMRSGDPQCYFQYSGVHFHTFRQDIVGLASGHWKSGNVAERVYPFPISTNAPNGKSEATVPCTVEPTGKRFQCHIRIFFDLFVPMKCVCVPDQNPSRALNLSPTDTD
jgi:hypothetical protein